MFLVCYRIKEQERKKKASPAKKPTPAKPATTTCADDDPYGADTDEDEKPGQ